MHKTYTLHYRLCTYWQNCGVFWWFSEWMYTSAIVYSCFALSMISSNTLSYDAPLPVCCCCCASAPSGADDSWFALAAAAAGCWAPTKKIGCLTPYFKLKRCKKRRASNWYRGVLGPVTAEVRVSLVVSRNFLIHSRSLTHTQTHTRSYRLTQSYTAHTHTRTDSRTGFVGGEGLVLCRLDSKVAFKRQELEASLEYPKNVGHYRHKWLHLFPCLLEQQWVVNWWFIFLFFCAGLSSIFFCLHSKFLPLDSVARCVSFMVAMVKL